MQIQSRGPNRLVLVISGVLVAAGLNAYALGIGSSPETSYLGSSLLVALPLILLLGLVAKRWFYAASLGLVGLLVFNAVLAARLVENISLEPLLSAAACVLILGGVLIGTGRAHWPEVTGGFLLFYLSAAILFEISILLQNYL
jgi:hypothetical protein